MASSYVLVAVADLAGSVAFFRNWLGYEPEFESTWFHLLVRPQTDGMAAHRIALMAANHPTQRPEHQQPVAGTIAITFEVDDVDAELARLQAAGTPLALPIRDEVWGQRHFMLRDPSGIWIDVVQQTEPEPGFWDRWG